MELLRLDAFAQKNKNITKNSSVLLSTFALLSLFFGHLNGNLRFINELKRFLPLKNLGIHLQC